MRAGNCPHILYKSRKDFMHNNHQNTFEVPPKEARILLVSTAVSLVAFGYAIVLASSSIERTTSIWVALLWLLSWPLVSKSVYALGNSILNKWNLIIISRALMVLLGVSNGMTLYQCSLLVSATILTSVCRKRVSRFTKIRV